MALDRESYVNTALAKYKYWSMATPDISRVFRMYPDLKPKLDKFMFNDGSSQDLLNFEGTIPVTYKGAVYNILIVLWVMDTHPYNPPRVYVKPTNTMRIKAGINVDSNGKIDVPYIRDWQHSRSELVGLLQVLVNVFSETLPVYAVSTPPSHPPSPPQRSVLQDQNMALNHESYVNTALAKYKYRSMATQDILRVFRVYPDLKPKLDKFVFNDGSSQDLLTLEGTIPITYKGAVYNIPIVLWVMDTHPYNPPLVYVKPTNTMRIIAGINVDSNGKIDVPYIRDWQHPRSELVGLLQVLVNVFSATPPVYTVSTRP